MFIQYTHLAQTSIGQVVDAVIAPLAPWAAVIPTKYYHTGKILHLAFT